MYLAIDIVFGFVTLVIFTIFNMQGLVDGPSPAIHNFVLSILFLLLWFLYGFIAGRKKRKLYIPFVIVFWIFGFIISTICNILRATPLWLLAFLYLGPLNGFRHFKLLYAYGYLFLITDTMIPLIITVFGYVIGNKMCKVKRTDYSL